MAKVRKVKAGWYSVYVGERRLGDVVAADMWTDGRRGEWQVEFSDGSLGPITTTMRAGIDALTTSPADAN